MPIPICLFRPAHKLFCRFVRLMTDNNALSRVESFDLRNILGCQLKIKELKFCSIRSLCVLFGIRITPFWRRKRSAVCDTLFQYFAPISPSTSFVKNPFLPSASGPMTYGRRCRKYKVRYLCRKSDYRFIQGRILRYDRYRVSMEI